MNDPGNKVYLKRVFNAPVEKVFHALTHPDSIIQWFGPKNGKTISANVSLEVGGNYQFEIEMGNATRFFMEGQYLEVVQPNRLVYTVAYRNLPGTNKDLRSVVTMELTKITEGTAMSFTQELNQIPKDMENRTKSWELMFTKLNDLL